MDVYINLYKKGSLKNLKKTIIKTRQEDEIKRIYEVLAISVLNYNIDGKGSAMVEKGVFEVVELIRYGELRRYCAFKNIEYIIMGYSKLEEMMLSPDWIVSEYSPFHDEDTYNVEEIMKNGSHATTEV